MKKTICAIIAGYLLLSVIFSYAYIKCDYDANLASCRNGLLCAGVAKDEIWLLSPFCNHSDIFLLGVQRKNDALRVYSDTFDFVANFEI